MPFRLSALVLLSAAVAATGSACLSAGAPANYEQCVREGNPVLLTFPEQCTDEDSGKIFTREQH